MRNILDILPHLQNKYSFKCLYKYATFFHEIYVDLNKKSMVQLCFLLQSVVIVCWVQLGFDWWSSTISLSLPPPQVVLFLFPSSSIMTFATLTTIKSPKPQIVHHPLLAYLWQNNSNLSKLPPNDVLFQYFFYQQYACENNRIKTDLKICKSRSLCTNQLHKLNMPSNLHNNVDTTRNQTKLPPKEVKFQEQYDKYWIQNAQKHIVHLGLGFRWNFVLKEIEVNESLD